MKETKIYKVFFDSNVIIDVLTDRPNSSEGSQKLLKMVATKEIIGILSAKQITDIHYVLRKYIKEEKERIKIIQILIENFKVIDFSTSDINKAIKLELNDFEDAVICVCATKEGCDYIVTNNVKNFKDSKIPVLFPNVFLREISKSK